MSIGFAERLKALRREHRKTQTEIGRVLHYGYTAIANYESGRNEPSIRDLIRLADYFQVSVDYLIGRSDLKQRVGGLKLVKRRVTRADLYKKYEKISLAQVLLWADAQTKKDGP